jgi:hypothetical protein
MGAVGAGLLVRNLANKAGTAYVNNSLSNAFNSGWNGTPMGEPSLFGDGLSSGGAKAGAAPSLNNGGWVSSGASSFDNLGTGSGGGGKAGLASSLLGGGSSSKYSGFKSFNTPSTGGPQPGYDEDGQRSWNAGAENYTPIVVAQAGPGASEYFSHAPKLK